MDESRRCGRGQSAALAALPDEEDGVDEDDDDAAGVEEVELSLEPDELDEEALSEALDALRLSVR